MTTDITLGFLAGFTIGIWLMTLIAAVLAALKRRKDKQ